MDLNVYIKFITSAKLFKFANGKLFEKLNKE